MKVVRGEKAYALNPSSQEESQVKSEFEPNLGLLREFQGTRATK